MDFLTTIPQTLRPLLLLLRHSPTGTASERPSRGEERLRTEGRGNSRGKELGSPKQWDPLLVTYWEQWWVHSSLEQQQRCRALTTTVFAYKDACSVMYPPGWVLTSILLRCFNHGLPSPSPVLVLITRHQHASCRWWNKYCSTCESPTKIQRATCMRGGRIPVSQ